MVGTTLLWNTTAGRLYVKTGDGWTQVGSASKPKPMSTQFKVGDRVRSTLSSGQGCAELEGNKVATVTQISTEGWVEVNHHGCWVNPQSLQLETPNPTSSMSNNLNLLEKAALAFKSEPAKSFRKAGITNGDDMLTTEGQTIFLTWLLSQPIAKDFKEQVVDPLLKEQDEK